MSLTQAQLKELLHYDPDTGHFTWLISKGRIKVGDIAGTKSSSGYVYVCINYKIYLSHRLAWLYLTGKFPESEVDHLNCIRNDNRISNLREATSRENSFNQRKSKNNSSGFKGVCWNNSAEKWKAQAKHLGKTKHLGYFNTAEEASEAYQNFAKQNHGEFYFLLSTKTN